MYPTYQIHPAAAEFPLMDETRLSALADDLRDHGQREPIRLLDGLIIDGRNRYRACALIGAEPRTEALPPDTDPWAYVWSLNGERRDLSAAQRYLIWQACAAKSTSWLAEQQQIRDRGNAKRSEKAKEQHEVSNPRAGEKMDSGPPTSCGTTKKRIHSIGAQHKAAASNTNRGTVERMDALVAHRPDLADSVRSGEMGESAAVREMRRAETIAKLNSIREREVKAVAGVYDVIVVDPPWPMVKIERDCRPHQSESDYPTMDEESLTAIPIPAASDCHLWLWTTQRFLPMAFRILDAWRFRYVCTFVWHKPGGYQPIDLPQYNCEFALYARIGSPRFIDTKALPTCFDSPRGAHSEKPGLFYDTVRRVTAGRRLDMFSRRTIEGFDSWGNEA